MSDHGKIIYILTKGQRCGTFKPVEDYIVPTKEKDNEVPKDDFLSIGIIYKESGDLRSVRNYEVCYNSKQITEYYDKKINNLRDELKTYMSLRKRDLEKAKELCFDQQEFTDLQQGTKYGDYFDNGIDPEL